MHSSISDNQFMIHILSNLTLDYELQLVMMERRVGDIERPLTVEEIRRELSLCFDRLIISKAEGEILKEHAFFGGQFKSKCQNCGQLGHKSFQCNNCTINNGSNNGNSTGRILCLYCCKTGHDKSNCFKLKKKEAQNNNNPSNYNDSGNRQNYESQDVVFTATSKNGTLSDDIWICDSGVCGRYCKSTKGMFNMSDIDEKRQHDGNKSWKP
jgi:hypothetical protein